MSADPKSPSTHPAKSEDARVEHERPPTDPRQRWFFALDQWLGARIEDEGYVLA